MTERKERSTGINKQIIEKLDMLGEQVGILSEAIVGDTKQIGLLERVRNLEQWVSTEKKLIYIVIGVIITDIVTRLWSLIAP